MAKTRKTKISVVEENYDNINEKDFFQIDKDTNIENIDEHTNENANNYVINEDEINKNDEEKLTTISFELIINGKKYLTYQELIDDKDNITVIDLTKKNLTKLADKFYDTLIKLDKLIEIKLSDNYFNTLSPKLCECVTVKKLDLSKNILCANATRYIYKLVNLEELNLSNCGDFSENICYLFNLKNLNLSENYKCSYVPRIQTFMKLQQNTVRGITGIYKTVGDKFLNLNSEKEFTLPTNINKLINLEKLTIKSCEMKSLPENIFLLKKLTHLNISKNKLKTLPIQIKKLANLTFLNIEENNIPQLPEKEICELANLKIFNFSSANLTKVTSKIWDIKEITSLDLRKVKTIPSKNNDRDISLIINSDTVIPENVKTVELHNKKGQTELKIIPTDIENLIIHTKSGIKLDNLPVTLKKLEIISLKKYSWENEIKWINEYVDKGYIKIPFGCEFIHKQNKN